MGPPQFFLSIFLGIYRNLKQTDFLNSCEGFLMAALTGHGHPSPLLKIAEIVVSNPCMKFEIFLSHISSFEVL